MGLLPKGFSKLGDDSQIIFNGKQLTELSDTEYRHIRGKEISMVFQDPMTSLNPVFTIGYQLSEVIMEHTDLNKKNAIKLGIEMLNKVGLARPEQIMKEFPHQLSGGMRQRIMIAMALSCLPKILIADEPTTALDVTIQAQILDLMKTLIKQIDTSVILITHDLSIVAEVCNRVIVMYAGKVVEEAPVEVLFNAPKHPYTVGLLNSIPSMTDEKVELSTIPGTVPLPEDMPNGCSFAPRCTFAKSKCFEQQPPYIEVEAQHHTSCWLYP